ncbi:phosphatidylethanolamine-binding protein [Massariosphaeria phaeospora]|uniref:Large ribosomal subunit protein mL38 n=1 Tax=Massariosphaeria phaeospora TaxID=100035 RepID=A0A7C8I464_9PLEO|nr:phosphatidylethanolamine-binding protein [Massariosphaeria phaeospora]
MPSVKPSFWQINACVRCVRQPASVHGAPVRLLSSSSTAREELQTQPPPPPPVPAPAATASAPNDSNAATAENPEYMKKWGTLDPSSVVFKRDERRLLRREGLQPVGSRRRRALLRRSANTPDIPFEQLPYQCFQEARKILLEDRQEKLKQIETQTLRLKNLIAQDPAVSGGQAAKEARMRSMRNYINELVILADINDPVVKKKFEDGQGDMNKPIYRHLASLKWRKYKRLVLEQRISQMNIVPDLLPALDLAADIDLGFGRKNIPPGEFVDSEMSESMPRLNVQCFEAGEKLVSVVVVDADVPVPEQDGFTYRCQFIASNILISPTQTSIPLIRIDQDDNKITDPAAKRIVLPWQAPLAQRGAPYHRLAVIVLEQKDAKALNVLDVKRTRRHGFILRSFVDKHQLKPLTATLFRTQWDDNMAGVMERAGMESMINVELKRKRLEPLPHKRRTERMR